MNVERDIAVVAVPFTFGVLITVYAETLFCGMTSAILVAVILIISTLLSRNQFDSNQESRYLVLIIAMCICGIMTGMTGISLNISLPNPSIKTYASDLGKALQEAIDDIPLESSDHKSLIKALLTGERSSLPNHITECFRRSGASHILALSGLHLGIIYGIISRILSILGNSVAAKRLRSIATVCICGLYTAATGAGPSIARAFIFILIGETIRLSNRHRSLSQMFFVSLIIQIMISPLAIRSISFQLSYAAMAGIAFIFPYLSGLWPENKASSYAGRIFEKAMRWVWNCASLSISCQLTTAPLAYLYFGSFPTYFLLTNLFALPLTGVLIPTAMLTLCLSWTDYCPTLLINTTSSLIELLLDSIEIIGSM